MLAPPLAPILAGLTLCAMCGMLCQTIATGYVTASAREGRSSAVGLYVTAFYVGGSMMDSGTVQVGLRLTVVM